MNVLAWISYLLFGVVIAAPLIQGDLFNVDKKYKYFKYVSLVLLLWWLVDFLRFVSTNGEMVFYLTLSIFPVVLLFTICLYIAIKTHFGHNIHRLQSIGMTTILIIDILVAYTNKYHGLFFAVGDISQFSFDAARNVTVNWFFYIHTAVAYIFLIITVKYILKDILRRLRENEDTYPFIILVSAIVIGVTFNLIHIFVYTFHIDPTILTIILVLSGEYYIFYIRDLKLLLGFNRNSFILDHLREMYVIVDELGNVVDASSAFIDKFDVSLDTNLKYEELLDIIHTSSILFKDENKALEQYVEGKNYFNTVEKPIHLPFYKYSGTFYLFFEQTANLKYIYDMNYVKTHDLMTKIYNRNFLEDMRDELDDSNKPFELVMFDLDGLKLVNDYLGHNEGDEHLRRFANQLSSLTREDNVYPIRLGGDEFVILAVDKPKEYIPQVLKYLEKLNSDLPFLEQAQYSYAVASRSKEDHSLKLVLSQADEKMYQMKDFKSNYKEKLEIKLKKIIKEK